MCEQKIKNKKFKFGFFKVKSLDYFGQILVKRLRNLDLTVHKEPPVGFEPTTSSLPWKRSTC